MNKYFVLNCDNTRYSICIIDDKVFGFSIGAKLYFCTPTINDNYNCSLFVDLGKFVDDISKIATEEDLKEFLKKLENLEE